MNLFRNKPELRLESGRHYDLHVKPIEVPEEAMGLIKYETVRAEEAADEVIMKTAHPWLKNRKKHPWIGGA